ncbi:cytochrome P450 [Thelephora ganbajun]|uniref:Cytochrome P450 n=1 Tax=Thelephora ganbajun TaxID=370292 RepID=A0ACB6Z8F6_THEGA|nr:cytochrome P450 [Thelephora ganbajun]
MSYIYATQALAASVIAFVAIRKWGKRELPYPPGPKGYPVIGNVLDIPRNVSPWEGFASMAQKYGTDVLRLNLLGMNIIVLSSEEAISNLVDQKSAIYSDRPNMPMMRLMGLMDWALSLLPYGEKWRSYRKLFHEILNVRTAENFDSHQYKRTHSFLWRLLNSPENFEDDITFLSGSLIMSIAYGLDVRSVDDPYLKATTEAMEGVKLAVVPGAFLVDIFPILRYVPSWFPGGGFKKIAEEVRNNLAVSVNGPMAYVKETMKSGEGFQHSVVSSCLSRLEYFEQRGHDETAIRDVAGIMFTTTALLAFFLVMVLNPHVMRKAQDQLDQVVGRERLPEYSDMKDLPYLSAIIKELLRWSPPLPLGFPKRVMQDDTYNGHFIPAGATIIENTWEVLRNPKMFPEPEKFDPERYLKDGKIDPSVFEPERRVFGSGRRICPGRHFSLRTLYLNIACVLSVFDIEAPLGEDGKPQPLSGEFDKAAIRCELSW